MRFHTPVGHMSYPRNPDANLHSQYSHWFGKKVQLISTVTPLRKQTSDHV